MPSNESIGLDDRYCVSLRKELRHLSECETSGIGCPHWFLLSLHIESQLLAQKQVLGGEYSSGPQVESEENHSIEDGGEDGSNELQKGSGHAL